MKNIIQFYFLFLLFGITAISCNKDVDDRILLEAKTPPNNVLPQPTLPPANTGNYSEIELEIARLINEYRISLRLKPLELINFLSKQCKDHNGYMIDKKSLSHDNFDVRYANATKELGAGYMGENVASKYKTAKQVVEGWIASKGHKENIESNKYTTTGIAVTADVNGNLYFTQIFYGL
jgi:uncharacterized protein YkwD